MFQGTLPELFSFISVTDERWMSYLKGDPCVNIFHHPAWSLLLAKCYGYHPFVFAVCNKDGEIMAGLPVMEIKSWMTGRRWVSLPFSDHCAPLYKNKVALDYLVNGLIDQALAKGFRRLELRGDISPNPKLQKFSPYTLHTLQLNDDFSIVDNRIHPMHKRNARTALKRGVHVEIGRKPEHLEAFYRLHIETRRKQGVPVQPLRFFELIGKTLLEENLGFILLAYHEEKVIAGMVLLGWGQILTYKYGASSLDSLQLRPNDLLFWTAIRWGCENGYKFLDLGRTNITNEGLRAFKSRWGAEETHLSYSILSDKISQPTDGRMNSVIKLIIKKSPIWVCRLAGELLYKHFG